MSVEKIVGYLRGYIVICVDGVFCERFLNICSNRGIFLWNVRRLGEGRICACISIGGFREIRGIARKTRTHISIIKRQGIPFILHRYRKRKTALVGVILFFALLWYLTSHITGIDVTGNKRIATAEIINQLKGCGIYYGAAVNKIDSKMIKNEMMTKFDDIAWIGINIKGSRAYIEVKERLDTPIRVDADIPCDIIAAKDGIIRLMEVKEGQSLVKINEFVEKGDLLVSGVVDSNKTGMRYVHSFGEVYAETIYKKTREYPFEYIEKIYTGNEKKRYSLSVMNKRLKLFFKDEQPFETGDITKEEREYKTPFSFIPSMFVETEKFVEYTTQNRTRSLEDAIALGEAELGGEIDAELGEDVEIRDKKTTYVENGESGVVVTVEYLCQENIAQQRIIDKTENLGYDTIEEE